MLLLSPVGSYAQAANRFDIVINELMADPSPAIGLPNSEFIELKNNSADTISLRNWKLGDGSGSGMINTDFELLPDSFVIICAISSVAQFTAYGKVIGISNFPSINNDEEVLILYSPEAKIIHAVEFSNFWYQNDVKKNGGWSLEMIDTKNPCSGISNWKASVDPTGGTPGRKNSVDGINTDDLSPALLRTYTIDSTTIAAVFDEPVDSNAASLISNYSLDGNIKHPISATPATPHFKEVILKFSVPLQTNTIYQLTVSDVTDCSGNSIGMMNKAAVGLPVPATASDIIINEILFNPPPDGFDYIELYNRSNKVFDLRHITLCNVNATGNFTNIQQLSDAPKLLFPNEFFVFIENAGWLRRHYHIKDQSRIIELPSLPSMPDDKGHIIIVNSQGDIIDNLSYDQQWHFALIDNEEGVSLERINYNDSTQRQNNWASAASASGFGTPGNINSQFRADLQAQGQVTVSPKIFSPDNSGFDDFATISCQLTEPGYVVNITIYDQKGRAVKKLARNATAGFSANFNWDGLDDQQKKLPAGHYIVLTEVFNLQGKTKKFKNVVTLAIRL